MLMASSKITFQSSLERWLLKPSYNEISVNSAFDRNLSIGSSVGLVRKDNQDKAIISKFHSRNSKGKSYILFAIADGMGGMAEGAHCASLLISTLLAEIVDSKENNTFNKLRAASIIANDVVYKIYRGMGGSTLSAILMDSDGNVSAINIGDSRIYKHNIDGSFEQVSIDDTIDGQLAAINKKPSLMAESNRLVQYVGMGEGLDPHGIMLGNIADINKFIITTDGAHYVGGKTIELLLKNSPNSYTFIYRLITHSLWCGGRDNSTVICLSINEIKNIFQRDKNSEELIQIWSSYGKYAYHNYLLQSTAHYIESKSPSCNPIPQVPVDPNFSKKTQPANQRQKKTGKVREKEKLKEQSNLVPVEKNKIDDNVQLEIIDYLEKKDEK